MHLSESAGQAMLLPTWTPTIFFTSTPPGGGGFGDPTVPPSRNCCLHSVLLFLKSFPPLSNWNFLYLKITQKLFEKKL